MKFEITTAKNKIVKQRRKLSFWLYGYNSQRRNKFRNIRIKFKKKLVEHKQNHQRRRNIFRGQTLLRIRENNFLENTENVTAIQGNAVSNYTEDDETLLLESIRRNIEEPHATACTFQN